MDSKRAPKNGQNWSYFGPLLITGVTMATQILESLQCNYSFIGERVGAAWDGGPLMIRTMYISRGYWVPIPFKRLQHWGVKQPGALHPKGPPLFSLWSHKWSDMMTHWGDFTPIFVELFWDATPKPPLIIFLPNIASLIKGLLTIIMP